jgi:hypothetical protein
VVKFVATTLEVKEVSTPSKMKKEETLVPLNPMEVAVLDEIVSTNVVAAFDFLTNFEEAAMNGIAAKIEAII